MNTFLKASVFSCAVLAGFASLPAFSAEPMTQIAFKPNEAQHLQGEAFILYALAARDARAATVDPTITAVTQNNITTYTFKDHVLKECGSHLNGTIELSEASASEATAGKLVKADFPIIDKNSVGITSFSFSMNQTLDLKNSQGPANVNGKPFDIKDVMAFPGFADAIAKIN